ncbi:hypothetical protein WA026_004629, partial [Henosepilachna vigintioctopunctata]
MAISTKWLFLLSLTTSLHAQDPRKRILLSPNLVEEIEEPNLFEDEPYVCSIHGCVKRSQSEVGPFWANRGKRGPRYLQSKLYAQEPAWVYITDDDSGYNEPFFVTRGKKNLETSKKHPLLLKGLLQDKRADSAPDNPFFAAR